MLFSCNGERGAIVDVMHYDLLLISSSNYRVVLKFGAYAAVDRIYFLGCHFFLSVEFASKGCEGSLTLFIRK